MPDAPNGDDLDRLIISDGDFGQAYLTQGWAARFVATLFRDFTLCFVGYSIDDPVLRYMTADRLWAMARKRCLRLLRAPWVRLHPHAAPGVPRT